MEEKIPNPPQATYILSVSTSIRKQMKDEVGKKIQCHPTAHQAFHFSLIVESTNRAAMSEYLAVMRPLPSGNRAYEYLERTAVVTRDGTNIDINTPVLEFDNDGSLFLRLLDFEPARSVKVVVTRYI